MSYEPPPHYSIDPAIWKKWISGFWQNIENIGSWTPVVSDGTNDATSSTARGTYRKIGETVFIAANITLSSLGSVSGNIRVTGLPFPCTSAGSIPVTVYGDSLAITAGHSLIGSADAGNTFIRLFVWDATTGVTAMQHSELTANGILAISGMYTVD